MVAKIDFVPHGNFPMPANKPTVFISSTIYDFRDVRSSMRFWLEEMGYQVVQSESNDFSKSIEKNAYEACLETIDTCDYFVLLIGTRVGGWYDKENKITITQKEYQRAYERLKEGKLRIITLVRKEIWDIKEDRKSLENYLRQQQELSDEKIGGVVNHPSKFLNDAEFTFQFLQEVGRHSEMKDFVDGETALPPGNWIHPFFTFRDVVDCLRAAMKIRGRSQAAILSTNLNHEFQSNLAQLLCKSGENVSPRYEWSGPARNCLVGRYGDSSNYKGKHLFWLSLFVLFYSRTGRSLSTAFLDFALASGEFLEYSQSDNCYAVGRLQKLLLRIRQEIDRLCGIEDIAGETGHQLIERFKSTKEQSIVTVANSELVRVFALHDVHVNLITLFKASILASSGGVIVDVDSMNLNGTSPLIHENENIKSENVSFGEAKYWTLNELKNL